MKRANTAPVKARWNGIARWAFWKAFGRSRTQNLRVAKMMAENAAPIRGETAQEAAIWETLPFSQFQVIAAHFSRCLVPEYFIKLCPTSFVSFWGYYLCTTTLEGSFSLHLGIRRKLVSGTAHSHIRHPQIELKRILRVRTRQPVVVFVMVCIQRAFQRGRSARQRRSPVGSVPLERARYL